MPYWRRLALVLAFSIASTALSLYLPLLSRDFFDRRAARPRCRHLLRIAAAFAG